MYTLDESGTNYWSAAVQAENHHILDRGAVAKRIAACVNACRGINPAAIPDMLTALRAAAEHLPNPSSAPAKTKVVVIEAAKQVRATIAKAESEETP